MVSLYFVEGRSSLSIGISTNSYSLLCSFRAAITLWQYGQLSFANNVIFSILLMCCLSI